MMKYLIALLSATLFIATTNVWGSNTPKKVLEPVSFENLPDELIIDERLWEQRHSLVSAIMRSLTFLNTDMAEKAYLPFEEAGITRSMVAESLWRFCFLLLGSNTYNDLIAQLDNEFEFFQSTGVDGRGTVRFTGYFRPVYQASQKRTDEYKFPLFKLPKDFDRWPQPHPTRVELEGHDGIGGKNTKLHGHELAWLRSRYEVFMIHIQGSAILEYPDGKKQAVGFAAGTAHQFRGIPASFLREHNVAWHKLGEFFASHPDELDAIMARNNRFIFFQQQDSGDPLGNFGVPVVEERSIAIDKLHLPPGAIGIIRTKIPSQDSNGKLLTRWQSRVVLNLDTGSAIKGPGRVDVFMGTGKEAAKRASSVYSTGSLYYLFAKK